MSDSENENWKKNEYYAKGEDSDFIEEEKEAIQIQNKRLQRMIDYNLVKESNPIENESGNDSDSSIQSFSKINDKKKSDVTKQVKEVLKNKKNLANALLNSVSDSDDEIITKKSRELKNKNISNSKINSKSDKSRLLKLKHKKEEELSRLNSLLAKKRKNVDLEVDDNEEDDEEDEYDEESDDNEDGEENDGDDKNKLIDAKEKKLFNQLKLNEERFKKGKVISDSKNKTMIENANKALAKGKGMFRKRKQKQGNAKLMNKQKYSKKEKVRKNYVKEYTEKPLVYTGEATGIRRDLSRSIKFK